MCWFLRRGENRSTRRKTSRSKDENQQQTQPTYDTGTGSRTRATLVGGERSHHCAIPLRHLSPLCHPCSPVCLFFLGCDKAKGEGCLTKSYGTPRWKPKPGGNDPSAQKFVATRECLIRQNACRVIPPIKGYGKYTKHFTLYNRQPV